MIVRNELVWTAVVHMNVCSQYNVYCCILKHIIVVHIISINRKDKKAKSLFLHIFPALVEPMILVKRQSKRNQNDD